MSLIQAAIGFDRARGDQVTVQHLQFDRTEEHFLEDLEYRNQARLRQTVLYSLIGLAATEAVEHRPDRAVQIAAAAEGLAAEVARLDDLAELGYAAGAGEGVPTVWFEDCEE